jgi:diadenosine tetraphosphate (Ap4A) HIT family hydrolase
MSLLPVVPQGQGHSAFEFINCPLCTSPGGALVYTHALFRVVLADEPLYPGLLRVVWNAHVREFSQLLREHRVLCMDVVAFLEHFVLQTFAADKCNIAALGNVVPHLHWHVVPRFMDDAHFPSPIWQTAIPKGVECLAAGQCRILETKASWWPALQAALALEFAGANPGVSMNQQPTALTPQTCPHIKGITPSIPCG